MKYLLIGLLSTIILSCQPKAANETTSQDSVAVAVKPPIDFEKAERFTEVPDFTQYTDVKEKKKAFFDFLRPMVQEENRRIKAERAKIKSLFADYNQNKVISESDSEWLLAIAEDLRMKDFDITDIEQRNTLLRRKDIVPASLFLAQAANESSWGTSRFAREANNLFGQWCFTPGCGVVPAQRAEGEKHEVQSFETVNDAVNSYVRNLNGHNAYKDLREIRMEIRTEGDVPDGQSLAEGLLNYSDRREEYVKEIQSMIRVNKLEVSE